MGRKILRGAAAWGPLGPSGNSLCDVLRQQQTANAKESWPGKAACFGGSIFLDLLRKGEIPKRWMICGFKNMHFNYMWIPSWTLLFIILGRINHTFPSWSGSFIPMRKLLLFPVKSQSKTALFRLKKKEAPSHAASIVGWRIPWYRKITG